MAFTKLIYLLWTCIISSHTKIKVNAWYINSWQVIVEDTKGKDYIWDCKDDIWKQYFWEAWKVWGLSNKFVSTQLVIWLYAVGTSYDLRKTHLTSLERGGGVSNGSFVSGSCPHTEEKRWLPMGLFTNFDIFSKRFSLTF